MITFRATVRKDPDGWHYEVVEPDDDGYYVKLTDEGTLPTWRQAMDMATGDALLSRSVAAR